MRKRLLAAPSVLPGLALTAGVAWLGLSASVWVGQDLLGFEKSPISGIMLATVIGMVVGNVVRLPDLFQLGIRFSLKRVLRLGIILLGIRLGFGDVIQVGAAGIPVIVLGVVTAGLITYWLAKWLNVSSRMSVLIAVGTSICGATAIVATAPAIEADQEETAYAVATITVFGLLAMFLYPYLANALFDNDSLSAGRFLGTSIHETAQVAGSGLIYAQVFEQERVLDVATVTKLVRNVFMALVIPLMAYIYHRRITGTSSEHAKVSVLSLFPLFILGFIIMAAVRTVGDATLGSGMAYGPFHAASWGDLTVGVKTLAGNFLAVAMAGVGLAASFGQFRSIGLKPLYVGLGAAVSVGAASLLGITGMKLVGLS